MGRWVDAQFVLKQYMRKKKLLIKSGDSNSSETSIQFITINICNLHYLHVFEDSEYLLNCNFEDTKIYE